MARIEGAPPKGLVARIIYWATRHKLGKVATPTKIVGHHPTILLGVGMMEGAFLRSGRVDAGLKTLASVRVATRVGCPF